MPDETPPSGGPPNSSFNHVNVGSASVGRVTVEKLDSRTGGPQNPNNELVDEIKVLGDRLDTSLKAMLDQIKDLVKNSAKADQTEAKQGQTAEKDSDKIIDLERQNLRHNQATANVLKSVAEVLKKDGGMGNQKLLDEIEQLSYTMSGTMNAGLKQFVGAHKTMMTEWRNFVRNSSTENITRIGQAHNDSKARRNEKYYNTVPGYKMPSGVHGPGIGEKAAEAALSRGQRFQRGLQNTSGSLLTYGRQKITETGHAGIENIMAGADRAAENLFNFSNVTEYATKKFKEFGDVAGAGLGNFAEYMISDFTKIWTAGDSLGNTFEFLNKSAKGGLDNIDSRMFIAGRSLQDASVKIREWRQGVEKNGFQTNAFMGFKDQNDVLGNMLTQLKRGGGVEVDLNATIVQRYMAEQLKAGQLTAQNTGKQLVEVMKLTAEATKENAIQQAAGLIKDEDKATADLVMGQLKNIAPDTEKLMREMIGSGGKEMWISKNQERYKALKIGGGEETVDRLFELLESRRTDVGVAQDTGSILKKGGKEVHPKTQGDNKALLGYTGVGGFGNMFAEWNAADRMNPQGELGKGSDVNATKNLLEDVFSNKIPGGAILSILGSIGFGNALLGMIATSTAIMAGKSVLGGLGGAAATAAGAAGAAAPAAGAAAAAGGGSVLGGLARGAGRVVLKGIPVVGGVVGGAADRAMGGSLMGSMMTGAAGGAVMGGIAGGGIFSIPGALIGGGLGALGGAAGYMMADSVMDPRAKATPSPSQNTPMAPAYDSSSQNGLEILGRGLYMRMDVQIEKLTEIVTVLRTNQQASTGSGGSLASNLPRTDDDDGSMWGSIRRLWG